MKIEQDFKWLCKHPEINEQYKGEYIAILDEKVVAHGSNLEEVIEKAKKFGDKPLISKNPEYEVLVV